MSQIVKEPLRTIYFLLGILNLLTGIAGVFLPVLPAAPFIVLAAYFFSKSSPGFHKWLRDSKWFGPSVRDWEDHQVIQLPAKLGATAFVGFSLFYSLYFDVWAGIPIGIGIAGAALLMFVWSRRSRR